MGLCCGDDVRREAVRRMPGRVGLDYVEVGEDQVTLSAFFLGKLPPELREKRPGLERFLRIEGGQRVRSISISSVEPVVDPDGEKDDVLVITVVSPGDFSTYSLKLVNVAQVDPRYERAEFSFKAGCPSLLDCAAGSPCAPETVEEPELNYLGKDYGGFRQLLLDRLALLVPEWKERHAPDLGIALVELLAYAGDFLSYYQDAVGTEAYLNTARERISVRRHARLVDYRLHEGCNARAWLCVQVSASVPPLDAGEVAFITGAGAPSVAAQSVLSWDALRNIPWSAYEVFEPSVKPGATLAFIPAHNEIAFYTWGDRSCCLARGSTSATLLDAWEGEGRALVRLATGDVLVFEEVRGPKTGLLADADPTHRCAVRLTSVTRGEDEVLKTSAGRPTPYVEVAWAEEDALPFPLCLSAIVPVAGCVYVENISVARGNVVLVDHGRTVGPEGVGTVEKGETKLSCECGGHAREVEVLPAPFHPPPISQAPVTWAALIERGGGASSMMRQDPRAALPEIGLTATPADAGKADEAWTARLDLLESGASDRHFVVEVDNLGVAHLRFGDGELGQAPPVGATFRAKYRVGNGSRGNVGSEAIAQMVLRNTRLSGVTITVRNPMPASGGVDPEPIAEAKLYAPHLFRKELVRAVVADDYAAIAEEEATVQRASARLVWTGSWFEAAVAVDPLNTEVAGEALLGRVNARLEAARRLGHDLEVLPARYVPIDLGLEVCVAANHQRGHVEAELLDVFSNRGLPGGARGFFHPDEVTLGQDVLLSRIIAAAQAVEGVVSVRVVRFRRLFEAPNFELENGVLPLAVDEVAQLDNDPSFPEHGRLRLVLKGGR